MVLILKFYHLGFIYIFHKQNAHSFATGTDIRIHQCNVYTFQGPLWASGMLSIEVF